MSETGEKSSSTKAAKKRLANPIRQSVRIAILKSQQEEKQKKEAEEEKKKEAEEEEKKKAKKEKKKKQSIKTGPKKPKEKPEQKPKQKASKKQAAELSSVPTTAALEETDESKAGVEAVEKQRPKRAPRTKPQKRPEDEEPINPLETIRQILEDTFNPSNTWHWLIVAHILVQQCLPKFSDSLIALAGAMFGDTFPGEAAFETRSDLQELVQNAIGNYVYRERKKQKKGELVDIRLRTTIEPEVIFVFHEKCELASSFLLLVDLLQTENARVTRQVQTLQALQPAKKLFGSDLQWQRKNVFQNPDEFGLLGNALNDFKGLFYTNTLFLRSGVLFQSSVIKPIRKIADEGYNGPENILKDCPLPYYRFVCLLFADVFYRQQPTAVPHRGYDKEPTPENLFELKRIQLRWLRKHVNKDLFSKYRVVAQATVLAYTAAVKRTPAPVDALFWTLSRKGLAQLSVADPGACLRSFLQHFDAKHTAQTYWSTWHHPGRLTSEDERNASKATPPFGWKFTKDPRGNVLAPGTKSFDVLRQPRPEKSVSRIPRAKKGDRKGAEEKKQGDTQPPAKRRVVKGGGEDGKQRNRAGPQPPAKPPVVKGGDGESKKKKQAGPEPPAEPPVVEGGDGEGEKKKKADPLPPAEPPVVVGGKGEGEKKKQAGPEPPAEPSVVEGGDGEGEKKKKAGPEPPAEPPVVENGDGDGKEEKEPTPPDDKPPTEAKTHPEPDTEENVRLFRGKPRTLHARRKHQKSRTWQKQLGGAMGREEAEWDEESDEEQLAQPIPDVEPALGATPVLEPPSAAFVPEDTPQWNITLDQILQHMQPPKKPTPSSYPRFMLPELPPPIPLDKEWMKLKKTYYPWRR